MANSLASLGNGNCIEPFPNGTEGQVLTMDGGMPVWEDPSSGVSTDGSNILINGSDGKAYLTCEDIQDCVGLAIAAGTGLTYDDALNAISATGVPITDGAGLPALGVLDTPTIYTDTSTGNVYYRDPAGVVVRLNTIFSVTSGPDAATVTSGPIDVDNGDTIHFWGNTIDFTVTPGSVIVNGEVALSADTRNSLTTGTDDKLYASDENTTFGTVAGNAPAVPATPSVAPTTPITGDNYIESYADKILFWEYDGAAWVLKVTLGLAGEITTFGTVVGNGPVVPVAPATAPATPASGDQYVESYDDVILLWEYDGAAWVLRTTIASGVNIYNADGTLTANRTVTMDAKSFDLINATAVDTGIGMENPNGTGYIRIDPTGDLEVGTSTAGSKIQLQANGLTVAQVLPAGILEVDGDGSADQSGLRFKFLDDASPVTLTAAHLGVDASGNVVIAPDAMYEICAEPDTAFDAGQRLRIPQESLSGCKMIAVDGPDCATATPAAIALGYNGTTLGFFAMREKLPVRTVTANASVNTLTDGVIVVDASTGNMTVTLPAPGACHPNHFYIKRVDTSANVVTIAAAATIDGAASIGLCNANALAKGNLTHVVWTGSAWITI